MATETRRREDQQKEKEVEQSRYFTQNFNIKELFDIYPCFRQEKSWAPQ